jgi:elongation factor G
MEPNPDKGFEFVDKIKGGAIPKEFIPAVEQGVEEALRSGPIASYPVVDVKVTLVDGSFHAVDSSEIAFKVAGSMACQDAVRRAKPILLEPIMQVKVTTPDEYMGAIIGDLNRRRGHMGQMETEGDMRLIQAEVPLSELFGYTTTLRTLSQGRASHHPMEFLKYSKAPESLVEKNSE